MSFEGCVDLENLSKLLEENLSWNAKYDSHTKEYYACATRYVKKENGKHSYEPVYMHRFILGYVSGDKVFIDHKNHNALDNRKENLRVVSNQDNTTYRRGKNSNNKSGYRNVCWMYGWWRIQLQIDGKNYLFLEKFKDVHEAGRFAEAMRQKYYGKFAGNG